MDEVHFPATRVAPPGCGFLRKSRSGAAAKSPGYPDFDGRSLFLYLIPTGIAVDVNRDGTILFGRKRDTTSEQAPFRCWCNDDDYFSADGGKDVAPPLQLDSQDDQIDSRRDLEDFARLHLVIGCLQKAIADGTIEVGLEWRDVGQKGGSPSIKAYQAAEVDGGSEYVKKADQTWASNQVIGERRMERRWLCPVELTERRRRKNRRRPGGVASMLLRGPLSAALRGGGRQEPRHRRE